VTELSNGNTKVHIPSDNQLRNLSRVTAILCGNWRASLLAHSLWEFHNYQLYCTVRADDGRANRHRIDGITGPQTFDKIRIYVSIRKNERQEEGLVHELLHANLIPLGYPRFWIHDHGESEKFTLAGGIINLADHIPMLRAYLSLGYFAGRFLGPSRPLNKREARVDRDLQQIADKLTTPDGYLTQISAYLSSYNIRYEPIYLAEIVVKQRSESATGTTRKGPD